MTLARTILIAGAVILIPCRWVSAESPDLSWIDRSTAAPRARARPTTLKLHGLPRTDDYYWLKNRENPEVRAYLEAENAYAARILKPLQPQISELYEELKSRLDDADTSVPYLDNGYWYEERYTEGADYPVIVRRREQAGAEEVVLDIPLLARGHEQYNLDHWLVSPDGTLVAYGVDFKGDRKYEIFVKAIATGAVIERGITNAGFDLAWALDNRTLFYVKADPVTVRQYQAWRHVIGTPQSSDSLVFEEPDTTFSVTVERTKSRQYILINSEHLQSTETRIVPAAAPTAQPALMEPRRSGVRHYVDHVGDSFFIRTNLDAPDYRLVRAPEAAPAAANWSDVVAERPGTYLADFQVFDRFIVLDQHHDALASLRIIRRADNTDVNVPRPVEIGVMSVGRFDDAVNLDPSIDVLRFGFSAPLMPDSIYDFNMATGELLLRKQSPATRWFKPGPYEVWREYATAADGAKIPITIVGRRDRKRAGTPTLLTGYGAYGSSALPTFRPVWFSLIDRGFNFAMAHIRGGREMGQAWYEQGRMFNKRNTFTDFIAAAETLKASSTADLDLLFARGVSAGGLLVTAVLNMRPDLFAGTVAEVPFVDVITTMSDASIPLTTFEYEEWGNPAIRDQYEYMISYSPYDNVARQNYPPLMVTAGWNDSQVAYFEPAKWVARLRATKSDGNPILFITELDAGHSGDSGRIGYVEELARTMAWLTALAGSVAGDLNPNAGSR